MGRTRAWLLAAAGWTGLGGGALAQPAAEIDEVIVTAQRRAENLQDVPLAVSAFQGRRLAEQGVTDVTQLQQLIPNVNIQQRTSFGVVTIRGVGFDILTAGAESGVAMHLDGVYVGRPAAGLAGFFDVERLEVARGPQGTLYGRNSTGGAVNIITRKPSAEAGGYVTLGVGSYEQVTAEAALGGPLSEVVRWRIAGKLEARDGYGENISTGRDIDDLDMRAVRAQAAFDLSPRASLLLSADYFGERDSNFVFHYGGPVAGCRTPGVPGTIAPPATAYLPTCGVLAGGRTPPGIRDVDHDFHPINDREFHGAAATLDWDLGWADLRAISAWRAGTNTFASDLDGTSADLFYVTREEDQEQLSQEMQLVGGGGTLEWVVGAYWFHEENQAAANGGFGPATGRTGFFQRGDLTTDAYAAFGQATLRLSERFAVTAGARYSREEKSIRGETAFAGAGVPALRPATLPDDVTFSAFTPKVGLEFRPVDDVLVFATWQEGFKSGGFSLGSLAAAYAPERITSWELGVKTQPWRGARLNATAFRYDYKDLHQGRVEGFVSVIRNAASATIEGAEVEFSTEIAPGLDLDVGAAWLDATFDDYTTADPARIALGPLDLSGNRLANSPRYTLNAGLQRTWTTLDGDLTLRGEVYVSGKVYFSAFNLEADSQSAYGVGNLILTYDRPDGWNGSLFVRNVTDETVSAGAFVSSSLVGAISSRSLLPPRTLGARIGRRF